MRDVGMQRTNLSLQNTSFIFYFFTLPFAGTIRVSILCDTIRRDVLGDQTIRATAFDIEQDQQHQQLPTITEAVVAPQMDGIVNQPESKNDSTVPTTIDTEQGFE
jgi:hypothetical protein